MTTAPRRATLDSVAVRAGVSKQTVANVMYSPDIVRPETASRVREAITALGYRPHRAAQQLRTKRSRVLALRVHPDFGDAVFDRFLHALTVAAGRIDYRVMLYTADSDEAEMTAQEELLDRWDIDGFILTGTHPGDPRTAYLAGAAVPCVTFGRPWDDSGHHPWVDVDGFAGTKAATEHLLALGHTRVGFLGWPQGSAVGDDRLAGWAAAMTAAGLYLGEPARALNDVIKAKAVVRNMLEREQPTAIVCASDILALGAAAEITAAGLRVGADVAVVGFDDTAMGEATGLTSVAQPLAEVATHVVRMIADLLGGDQREAPEQVVLPPRLVVRSSSGPPP